jgi:hypothetical protein
MSVSVPSERCYYYECSQGDVRLTLFLPPEILEIMVQNGELDEQVVTDYPDGVDLDCTEPDFNEFQNTYGFSPEYTAEELQNAFYAIFSSTKNWNTYRGTGLIHADELESKIPEVKEKIKEPADDTGVDEGRPLNFEERYRRRIEGVALKAQNKKELRELILRGIDQRKTIDEQKFRAIRMSKGRKPQEVFSLLQNKKQ